MSEDSLLKLNENPSPVRDEAVRLLLKIADNILKNPLNQKVRTLQKNNKTVFDKIVSVKGGTECLKLMGFQENGTCFVLPSNCPTQTVEKFKHKLNEMLSSLTKVQTPQTTNCQKDGNSSNKIKRIVLPPLVHTFTNPFLREIEERFHFVLSYENKPLLERAYKLLPVKEMENKAAVKLRTIQESYKKEKVDFDLSIQDTLIIELLDWFKSDFFTWVNTPDCSFCGGQTKFSHTSTDNLYTNRVEVHRCITCGQFTPFPRYNDLNILLETRKGRCGEWANTFTLFCRALGWDARFVVDSGDHVWTEVYSVSQKRWIHCDPCENVCDTPLMYETSWGKNITYVIAYSAEEIQDVTWRYSCNHKKVLQNRNLCGELELINALMALRKNRQKNFAASRKLYLTKRVLSELVELTKEKQATAQDHKSRTSGSLAWRLARGETELSSNSQHVWCIKSQNKATLKYSASLNKYEFYNDEGLIEQKGSWNCGVFQAINTFRKEEKDWKTVYICRKEGEASGLISWKFQISDAFKSSKVIDNLEIKLNYATFEDGAVKLDILSPVNQESFDKAPMSLVTNSFSGSSEVTLTVNFSGGKGEVAWQHAQLFRQKMDSDEFPLCITITIKDKAM